MDRGPGRAPDRLGHQPDRVGIRELALTRDGEIVGLRADVVDNLGAYVRAPEPATTFRPLGNYVGPYRVRNVELRLRRRRLEQGADRSEPWLRLPPGLPRDRADAGRGRGAARARSGQDPAAEPDPRGRVPVRDPVRGAVRLGRLPGRVRARARDGRLPGAPPAAGGCARGGRLFGIGIGLAVDPSISNMGYITVALPPEVRQAPGYNPKSGAADWAQVRVNASGKAVVTMGTAPQGQGHETAVAQIVADELGLTPGEVTTTDEFDSHTSVWSVSSGSYSSRFSGVAA